VYPAVRSKDFISAVRSLFLSRCLIVQISLPYKRVGRANVLYNFNLFKSHTNYITFKSPIHYSLIILSLDFVCIFIILLIKSVVK
jgi:inner membrane protein involved in colicin E2 resistance